MEQAPVPQHLQLLPNLVVHVRVLRMQPRKLPSMLIDIRKQEFLFLQRFHDLQDIQSPPAPFCPEFFQRTESSIGVPEASEGRWLAVLSPSRMPTNGF